MNEMIERVAVALAGMHGRDVDTYDNHWEHYLEHARVAIEAMEAGLCSDSMGNANCWCDMFKAALA